MKDFLFKKRYSQTLLLLFLQLNQSDYKIQTMSKTKIATNLFFLIGLCVLGYMIYKMGIDVMWGNIKQTGWWFAAIIGVWAIVYLINALSFRFIIQDGEPESKKIRFLKLFKITISGYAINYITPFGLLGGEPYKILELKPYLGIQKATSSVLLYMMMHFVSHFIFWMISIPLLFIIVPNVPTSIRIILAIAGAVSLILLYWSFTVYTKGIVSKALSLAAKLPFLKKRVGEYKTKHSVKIEQMDYLIADLYKNRKKDFIVSLSLELLARYVLCVEVLFMMYAINYPITFSQTVIIESIQSMIGNLFFFMPMQLGAREGGFVLAMSIMSMPAAHGIFVGLCMRIRELVWTVVGILLIKVKPTKNLPEHFSDNVI